MKDYFNVAVAVIIDMLMSLGMAFTGSLRIIISLTNLIFPYICLLIGEYCYKTRGYYAIGGEMFLPLIVFFVMAYIKNFANRIGKGIDVPRPQRRFTKVHENGEVTVENRRAEEMILYLSDLEDWLEYKHLL